MSAARAQELCSAQPRRTATPRLRLVRQDVAFVTFGCATVTPATWREPSQHAADYTK
jgi:hypothetical protein